MKPLSLFFIALLFACNPEETTSPTQEGSTEPTVQPEDSAAVDTPTSQPTSQPSDDHQGHEGHGEGIAPTPGAQAGWQHYGAPFSLTTPPISVDEALQTCVGTGTPCRVQGTVDRVCQARGCWFTVASEATDQEIRIRMQDYGFFVPRDAMGQSVIFEGILTSETISQAQLQHYANDEAANTGEPAAIITGPAESYQFMISAAELQRATP